MAKKITLGELIERIPHEHQKTLRSIVEITARNARLVGIKEAFEMINNVTAIPPEKLSEFDELDGG